MDDFLTENLKYLLWDQGISKDNWSAQLASWLDKSMHRADEVLAGAGLVQDEWERIEAVLHINHEILSTERLFGDEKNILQHNIIYLTNPPVKKGEFAQAIDVEPGNISRWRKGVNAPSTENQRKICRYFGLAPNTNLCNEPLFLSTEPIGVFKQRQWLMQRIGLVDKDDMEALFPALKKLLE
jgi:hypothetical protein